jgi:HAD superfamily hydrolase (TIGR01493 family)
VDVRALVFDVFGTVVDWRAGIAREVRRLLPGVDAEAVADAWRDRYAPSMERVRRGELPWTGLDELHRASLDELLPEHGASDAPEDVRAELVLAWHRLDPWPDSVEGLSRLKARYVIASLSNGNIALLVDMAKPRSGSGRTTTRTAGSDARSSTTARTTSASRCGPTRPPRPHDRGRDHSCPATPPRPVRRTSGSTKRRPSGSS